MSILVLSLETCTREGLFLPSDYQLRESTAPHSKAKQAEALPLHYSSDSLDLLWKDYFRHPSQWWDNRSRKSNPGSPDFKHKTTNESLWIYGWHNPCWVQEELRKRGLHPIEAGNGEFAMEKEQKKREVNGIHHHGNQQRSQSDSIIEAISLVALLKACAKQKNLHEGSKLHTEIVDKGLLKNVFVGNTLVHMYAKCGALEKAQEVFEELPMRTVVSWNALITGYTQEGCGEEVFNCLEQMQLEGFSPDAVTFACVLNACGSIENVYKGQELHAEIVKYGLLKEGTSIVGTALVDMYANCGMLAEAQEVFNTLLARDVVCWTALIAGYAQHSDGKEALKCYERMHLEGCSPNAVTYSCILKACGSLGALEKGQDIHAKITREGLLDKDVVIANALVDMYAKCGFLEKAQDVFNELQNPDLLSWTALITGYAQYGYGEEALICFEEMQCKGVSPDVVTFSCILKACSSIGFVYRAQEIHAEIVRDGSLETNRVVCTALVDTYANCGMLAEAQEVFDNMPVRDVIAWTALMEGYAQLGKDDIVFSTFDKMIEEGNKPNFITFTIVLNACCHRGLLDKGEVYFEIISMIYGIFPTLEHHTCMVDLFGRAGNLDKAVVVIEKMPFSVSLMMWHTLICACRQCGNLVLGSWAFNHATRLNVEDASTYICMRNMYAGVGMQQNVDKMGVLKENSQLGLRWWTDPNGI